MKLPNLCILTMPVMLPKEYSNPDNKPLWRSILKIKQNYGDNFT